MSVRAVSHIAIGVKSIEEALPFYCDIIGLKVTHDAIEEFPESGQIPAHRRRGVYLRWSDGPDESMIVLDEQPRRDASERLELFGYGIHHFGFWVDDVASIFERAVVAGVAVISPPSDNDTILYGEPSGKLIRTAMLRDPDGNIVQLEQRLSG